MKTWPKNKEKGAKEGGHENMSQDPEQECNLDLRAKASQPSGEVGRVW